MTITIDKGTAELHSVTQGMEHADIFIKHGRVEGEDHSRAWLTLTINSSFGTWGNHWHDIGDKDWREFVGEVGMSYLLEKLAGANAEIEDLPATVNKARSDLLEMIEEGFLDKEDISEARAVIEDWSSCDINRFIDKLSETEAFGGNAYELKIMKPRPTMVSFWEQLWEPWAAQMKTDLEAEMADQVEMSTCAMEM